MKNPRERFTDQQMEEKNDGKDWARMILRRHNQGESFTITVMDMAKRALGMLEEGK